MAINKLSTSSVSGSKQSSNTIIPSSSLVSFPVGLSQYGFNNSLTNSGTFGSISTNTGTYTTSPVKFGTHSLSFNGTSGYANIGIPQNLNTFTVGFWVYVRDISQRSYVIDFRPLDVPPFGYWLYDNNNTATFGGSSEYTFSFTPTQNTWLHWAMVVDGNAGTMTWYQNGSVLANASRTCQTNNFGYFTIGTYSGVVGGNQDQYFANMVVDNLYFSDKALTSTQISGLYSYSSSF